MGAGAILGLRRLAAPATAGADGSARAHLRFWRDHAVFVQTDNLAGNQVVAYDRAADGTSRSRHVRHRWRRGSAPRFGRRSHRLQGSLAYDQRNALLYAVNAGSNTVSVFSVRGDDLSLRQVIGSGGVFPVSVAVHGNLVYVLNALNGGSIQGYVSFFGHLFPLPGSYRNLGLAIPSNDNQFVSTPGQVAFSPDGSQLIVTTKASGNEHRRVSVSGLRRAVAFPGGQRPAAEHRALRHRLRPAGHLVVADAGPSTR